MSDKERWAYEEYLYNKVYEEDIVETAREDGWIEGYDEGMEDGQATGIAQGIAQGKSEAILEMIQKMKDEGVDQETIFRITGIKEAEN